jgi:pantetheine-phosphate adenylyltransferase
MEQEMQRALMGRRLAPDVDYLFLMSAPEHTYVTSAIVREVARLQGDLNPFVPEQVAEAIKRTLAASSI